MAAAKRLMSCWASLSPLMWMARRSRAASIQSHVYGGVSIVQMSWREGCSGVSTLSDTGTKREAWQWLCAAIRGAQLMRDSIKDN